MIAIPGEEGATTTFGRASMMRLEVTVIHRPGTDPEDIIDAILDVSGVEGTVHKEAAGYAIMNGVRLDPNRPEPPFPAVTHRIEANDDD